MAATEQLKLIRLLLRPEISVRVYFFEKANLGVRSDLLFLMLQQTCFHRNFISLFYFVWFNFRSSWKLNDATYMFGME